MQKSSIFITEFTVINPLHLFEQVGDKYNYKEDDTFDAGYYHTNAIKPVTLFKLITHPQNYIVTQIAQNDSIFTLNY